jgi:hypothetical protein
LVKPPHRSQDTPKGSPPPPPPKEVEPEPPHDRGFEKRKHWTDYLAVGLAALVLITTGYQGWVARNSEQHQLRAYVGLIPGDIDNFGDPKLQKFEFVRKNYGQTPAYDVLVTEFGQSVVGFGQPIPGNPIKIEGEILRGNFTLFPSGELRMGWVLALTQR